MRVLVLAAGLAAALCGGEVLADPRVLADVELERAFEGMPFVRLTVNGSEPLAFLIDTGGAGSILDRDVAKRLGMLPVPGRASVSGVAALDVGVVPKAKIRLAKLTLEEVRGLLRLPGKRHLVTVRRNAKKVDLTLMTKELL